jgi:ribosomal protein S18 acetylase RimI-like enzyme
LADAENAGPCLGLVALVRAGGAGEAPAVNWSVAWLLVDPRHRRLGIARSLVLVAVAAAAERGAVRVTAETRSDWTAARRFWESIARADRPPHDDGDQGGWDVAEERVS